jgi:hypothetical protein
MFRLFVNRTWPQRQHTLAHRPIHTYTHTHTSGASTLNELLLDILANIDPNTHEYHTSGAPTIDELLLG